MELTYDHSAQRLTPDLDSGVYIDVDLNSGEVTVDTDLHSTNTVPMPVWHGVIQRFCLRGSCDVDPESLDQLIVEILPKLQAYVDSLEVVWDGSNFIARRRDPDEYSTEELRHEIEEALEGVAGLNVVRAEDFDPDYTARDDVSAQTTDEELDALSKKWADEGQYNGVVLVDIYDYLYRVREEWRSGALDD